MKLWWSYSLLLAVLLGCVNVERSYPDKHYFTLEITGNQNSSSDPAGGVLEISGLSVSRRYEGQSFVYRISDTGYESDFYNQFLIAPATLITEELRKGLTEAKIFAHVINSSSELFPNYRLEGTVNALYGDFRNLNAPKAILEIQFFLTSPAAGQNRVLLDRSYSKSVSLNARTPEALVKGWDEGLSAVLVSLIADLKAANLSQNTDKNS